MSRISESLESSAMGGEHLLRELPHLPRMRFLGFFDDDAIPVLDLQLDVCGVFRYVENLQERAIDDQTLAVANARQFLQPANDVITMLDTCQANAASGRRRATMVAMHEI